MNGMGREQAVIKVFNNQLKQACLANGITDICVPFSGQDGKVNADEMFAMGDNFFLIEFKSYESSIEDENQKKRAHKLCRALLEQADIERLHRYCHYIMWGDDYVEQYNRFKIMYSVYQNRVCRASILTDSPQLGEPNKNQDGHGDTFALEASLGLIGVIHDDFIEYLRWLYSTREKEDKNFDGPVCLYATSSDESINGIGFNSLADFFSWAKSYLPNRPRPSGFRGPK